ncbi:MAG: ATP-grasp domain-containing protein [Prolixibacteraceae bacterium]|nr:ATP-grasp domain-containing protein [Prolixibacteraceae bacterium]
MRKFSKILIANRGEIALRIVRAARAMNLSTVAIYSAEEKNALHVQQSDEAHSLGSGSLSETYLNIEKIINIAKRSNADAVHPGYGFLSENPGFAQACLENDIVFVGPSVEVLRQTGNKTTAKAIARRAGVRVPKAVSFNPSDFDVKLLAGFRFPLLIKAAHGGGGKGMQLVYNEAEIVEKAQSAGRLALQYFGNGEIFIEEYIENARHIEVQVLADNYGKMIHLFERDCTVQRKHQKIIEEAPATCISDKTRTKIQEAALSICREVGYTNAGTVEFLVNEKEEFFFLEINPRIQVEHRVSELITGIDIAQWQLKIAAGNELKLSQDEIVVNGHAIEARLYAEDPENNFAPSAKPVASYHFPGKGVSVEHAISVNEQSGQFDPLLAKIIVWNNNRDKAVQDIHRALSETAVFGPETNLSYLLALTKHSDFQQYNLTTHYCNDKHEQLLGIINQRNHKMSHEQLLAAAVIMFFYDGKINNESPFNQNWRIWHKVEIELGGQFFSVDVEPFGEGFQIKNGALVLTIEDYRVENLFVRFLAGGINSMFYYYKENNARVDFSHKGKIYKTAFPRRLNYYEEENIENSVGAGFSNVVKSPLHGKIVSISIKQGQIINKGDVLLTIESMKSENAVRAAVNASVKSIAVSVGSQVTDQSPLVYLEEV